MSNNDSFNWLQILEQKALDYPNNVVLTESINGTDQQAKLTYVELSQKAKALAVSISQKSQFGDRVILLIPNSIDYVVSFFACIYAGVMAVPAYPPHNKKRDWSRLNAMVNDCQPCIALYLNEHEERLKLWCSEHQFTFNCVAVDDVQISNSQQWQPPQIDKHDIAYLQYSSGSTGEPKGVMLSHANLISNTRLITDSYHMTREDKLVNWLPLYHDMGFVGGILSPISVGAQTNLLPSATVAHNPYILLKVISDLRATMTAAPNFIFDLAVNKMTNEEKVQLDLSSLRVIVNGAEPINAETLTKFNACFAEVGLDKMALKPSYGMAEACLLVTATPIEQHFKSLVLDPDKLLLGKVIHNQEQGRDIACSGKIISDTPVKIVHQETRVPLPDGYIGEIMVKGDSISRGYWQKPDLNKQTFNLSVDGKTGFMATGDLGFIENNYLYVSGRKKEMLIINGRNYYPQDIEHSLLSLSDTLMPHGAAVFEVLNANNNKEIILVTELTRKALRQKNHQEIIQCIKEVISEEHELKLNTIILLKPVSLAKTSSGKIQRLACRQLYLNEQLEAVASWSQDFVIKNNMLLPLTEKSTDGIALWIISWIAIRLSVPTTALSVQQQLTQIGLDSIDAMTLTHELSKQLELPLTPEISWSYPSIEALSHYLTEQVAAQSDKPSAAKTPTEGII